MENKDFGMKKKKVAVIGATGVAGQQFLASLSGHPYFEVTALAAHRGLSHQFFSHEALAQQIRDYSADGVVFHGIKSCRFVSSGMADTREYITRRLEVPSLYIESDLIDPRYWSDAQIKNRVDAFFEALQQRGGPKRKQPHHDTGRTA